MPGLGATFGLPGPFRQECRRLGDGRDATSASLRLRALPEVTGDSSSFRGIESDGGTLTGGAEQRARGGGEEGRRGRAYDGRRPGRRAPPRARGRHKRGRPSIALAEAGVGSVVSAQGDQ